MASRSLKATQAVAPVFSSASAAADPDGREAANGPIRRAGRPWRAIAARMARHRASLAQELSGPDT